MILQPLFIGTSELLIIAGIALLIFGGKKLPELMRGLGQGIREFKRSTKEVTEPFKEVKEELLVNLDEQHGQVKTSEKENLHTINEQLEDVEK